MASQKEKILAAAIIAVLIEEEEGEFLRLSIARDRGDSWTQDHRRSLIGRRNLFRSRSRRSTSR
jgi:hypothetical protein